jgi:hypothetical protein
MISEVKNFQRTLLRVPTLVILIATVFAQPTFGQAQQAENNQSPSDPFILGPSSPIREYTSREAINWGRDFVFSPTEARNRVVLFAYDFRDVDEAFFQKMQTQILEKSPKIAVISSLPKKKLRFTGNESGFFGVPIILDGRNEPIVRNFVKALDNLESYERIVPAIMALSALKTNGIDPDYFAPNWTNLTYDRPWSGKIATSIQVDGKYKFTIYIASATGWDITQNPPEAMATLSEVSSKISSRF